VLVAIERGRPTGFLAVLLAQGAAIIDLIGVASQSQRCGIGAALVDAYIERWRGRAAALRVGTQEANVASLRLYEGRGFRAVGRASVWHAHLRGGRPE
jgi:ribosomal protein S18 acetylase RimI-like enzyme